jgi:excisionase family DNA binding protein
VQRRPIYVRLPEPQADALDRAAFERKVSKQDLVASLISTHLDAGELELGRHEFRPGPAPDVLTAAEAAELLRTTEAAVVELAESGELPGRHLPEGWRFVRAAVLAWLSRA